jgi:hypothetical protein
VMDLTIDAREFKVWGIAAYSGSNGFHSQISKG